MAKPIHMMVRVKDEARSVDFYRKAFGLEIADRVDFRLHLIYMRGSKTTSRSS
jgi:lactoylglutathione lyase